MKERCLTLLNLPINATKADIKKAYRRLAFEYHPDKNPSKDTQAKFIEITKAYEYLLDENAHPFTKVFNQNNSSNQRSKKQTEQEKQKAWHNRYRETVFKRKQTKAQLFDLVKNSFIYRLSKISGIASGIITLIIILNYLILTTYKIESKVNYHEKTEPQFSVFKSIELESKKEFYFTLNTIGQFELFDAIGKGQSIYLNTTYLLNDVKSIEFITQEGNRLIINENSMNRYFVIYLLVFIPFLIILFFEGPNDKYLASIDALTIISTIIIIIFSIHGAIIGLFSIF